MELSVSLVHLVSFQQTETGSSQQMVLNESRTCFISTHNPTLLEPRQCFLLITCFDRRLSYLIIHDDLVCHRIEQRGLCDELFLGIFVFFFTCLLDIVSCQCVQTGHLVLLMVSVVEVPINTSCLQKLDKVLCFALLVVLQLKKKTSPAGHKCASRTNLLIKLSKELQ